MQTSHSEGGQTSHSEGAHSADSNEKSIIPIFIFWVMADCIYNSRVTKLDFQIYNRPKKCYSTVVKFTEKMRNEQKRMKNQFFDLIFRVIVDFVHKIHRKIDQFWVQKWPYLKN